MTINSTKGLQATVPTLFQPTVIRSVQNEPQSSITFNLVDANALSDTNIDSTSSFKYSVPGTGLRSTQQLNIDWSEFANHTFFNSAQVKVNVTFDKIQNQYPFDGTNKEVENFLDGLTGYEKYLFDSYPKYKGYLIFSGTNAAGTEGLGGTYVTVKDLAGAAFPQLSRKTDGTSVLNPGNDPMTIEYWLYVPTNQSSAQVVLDKHSGSMGFMITLETTGSAVSGSTTFRLVSGSATNNVSIAFNKGTWNHFAWTWDRTPGIFKVSSYVNGLFANSSSMPVEFGTFSGSYDLVIGSGSALGTFTPKSTLSGAIDELRIWHEVRSPDDIRENMQKTVFASETLKAYYKFDEASGSNSNLVIDASSNSMHGKLNSTAVSLGVRQRATGSFAGADPMIFQATSTAPVLFPMQPDVMAYRSNLLVSASAFDLGNPNIITRLIPRHYLLEGQVESALSTEEGEIVSSLASGTDPRSTSLGATQVLLLLLYTWAKFFDEMKLYTQAFADLGFVDYDNTDTIPDQFLQELARSQGIELPPLFTGASIAQFLNGNNIQSNVSTNSLSLQYVQNQIWRRILINLRDVVRSKGTLHGVKTFIRSVGIDPDNNFRIREYGGPTKQNLNFVRDTRNEISTMLSFASGGLLTSPFLSGNRVEPGYPDISGAPLNDYLLTSGSWTYEGIYRFPKGRVYGASQSLVRFYSSGAFTPNFITFFPERPLLVNVVAVSGSNPIVNFFALPDDTSGKIFSLSVTGADIFDGDQWYISIGRQRMDDGIHSNVSSSYFLRVAKQSFGTITTTCATAAYYDESDNGSRVMWSYTTPLYNAFGTFFQIGSRSLDSADNYTALTDGVFLGAYAPTSPVYGVTDFNGQISQIRFWSKYLTDREYPEHVRNFRSVGVLNPLANFNFDTVTSGSFQRLRIDASTDQQVTGSDSSGRINIFDFSQNNLHLSGTAFPVSTTVINPERFYYSYISPKYDEGSTVEKIRIRSFQDYANVQATPWAAVAPVYEIPRSEQPTDSTKFTIDFSVIDSLDQDIVTIFGTLDSMDNMIGNPELVFSEDYPGLANLRKVYFNKLTDKMNLKGFFEFYKWFDTNIGTFVQQLIPRKTKFLGTNFVVESHMLERPKFQYQFEDSYLGDNNRSALKDTILLEFFETAVTRY